jgi:hypothetical protein
MNQMIKLSSAQFVLGCLFLTLSSCSSLDILRPTWTRNDFTIADEKNPAVKMLCAWEPVEGTGLDGIPTRGFAGQILFFNHQNAEPVVVEGDVRIFLFDDVGTPSEQAKPIRQFDFKGQSWNLHANQTTLGPSYNVFIPYTRENYRYLTNCALRVRLTPKNGPTIYSHNAKVPLPGPKRPSNDRTASHQTPIGRIFLQAGQQGANSSMGQQFLGGSNVNVDHPNAVDPQFQSRKQKMQHLEQIMKQYMQSQKTPARTQTATPHILESGHPHILSQPVQRNTFSDPGRVPAGRVASVNYGLTPGMPAGGQVQPTATHRNPMESRFNDYQTGNTPLSIQPHPIQHGHPLKSGMNPIPRPIHSLSPNHNAVPFQQFNRLPTSNLSHPVFNSEQGSPRRHPLGELQQHPLEGFSSQSVPTGRQSRLKPTVSANAAPLGQVNATNFNLRPETSDSIASQNASIDRRLSFAGR